MTRTPWSRKIDKMGRIVLPIKLREKYGLVEGLECPIYIYEDPDGRVYICLQAPPIPASKLKEAMELIYQCGMTVVKNEDNLTENK